MSSNPIIRPTDFQRSSLAYLRLGATVEISTADGRNFRPSAKKAQALFAIIALSNTYSVSRHRVAATLWSGAERAHGLARVRDLLYNLRKEFGEDFPDILEVGGKTVSFKPGSIQVDASSGFTVKPGAVESGSVFLADLDGIDPSLDRWLRQVRLERDQASLQPKIDPSQNRESWKFKGKRPSVVVTELDDGGVATTTRFARGLTDELGSSLSKLRWFTTIARGSHAQRLSAGGQDFAKLGDYALIGSLYCGVNNCRLLLKLVNLDGNGSIEWTSLFKSQGPFSLDVQEELANAVAASIDTELLLVEINRQRKTAEPFRDKSYALVLQAIPAIYRLQRDRFLDAGHLLEEAVLSDMDSALACSWLAYWHIFFVGQGWATHPAQSMVRASRAAECAMLLDPKDARAVTISGHVKAFLNGRLDEAMTLHELALQLNSALPLAWHLSGMTHAYAGRLDDALRCIVRCRHLAPTDPLGFFAEGALGIVYLLRNEHEAAVALGRRVTERQPNFTSAYKSYLAALGHLGRKAEAKDVLERLMILDPRFSLHRFHATAPYKRATDLEHYTKGLRRAGVT